MNFYLERLEILTANRVKFDREKELNSAFESTVVYNYFSRLKQELRPCLHGVGDPGLVG